MTGKTLLALTLLGSVPVWTCAEEPTSSAPSPTAPNRGPANDGNLFPQATADAKQKMDAAKAIVTKELEKTAAYLSAKLEVAKQAARLDEAKRNDAALARFDAEHNLAVARDKMNSLLEKKLDEDVEYASAKKDYESLIDVPTVGLDSPDVSDLAKSPEHDLALPDRDPPEVEAVRETITRHNLRLGMTFDECCRSAGSRPQQITNDRNYQFCRWTIRAPVGRVSQTERWARGTVRYGTTYYGTVGYVHATFIDGRLASYERRGAYDEPLNSRTRPTSQVWQPDN